MQPPHLIIKLHCQILHFWFYAQPHCDFQGGHIIVCDAVEIWFVPEVASPLGGGKWQLLLLEEGSEVTKKTLFLLCKMKCGDKPWLNFILNADISILFLCFIIKNIFAMFCVVSD